MVLQHFLEFIKLKKSTFYWFNKFVFIWNFNSNINLILIWLISYFDDDEELDSKKKQKDSEYQPGNWCTNLSL